MPEAEQHDVAQEDERANMVYFTSTYLVSYLCGPKVTALEAFLGLERARSPHKNALYYLGRYARLRHITCRRSL